MYLNFMPFNGDVYIVDVTKELHQKNYVVHMHVHIQHTCTCAIDAWAFKGTTTGYIFHVPQ